MANVLKITDGTTTVDFLTDAAYSLQRWAPAVATRRAGDLGGRGPYEDVAEEMELIISGASAATKLETLVGLMEQAAQWARGEPVSAVTLHYQPSASSDELRATILGPVQPGQTMVELPGRYDTLLVAQALDPVVLRFRRLGVWLGDEVTATSAASTAPTTLSVTGLTSRLVESPFVLKLENLPRAESVINDSFILVSSGLNEATADSRVLVIGAEMASGATNYTTVSDAGNLALSGNVLRYTPSGAGNYDQSDVVALTSGHRAARRWAMFINYRNNSATTSFRVRGVFKSFSERQAYETREVVIPAGVSTPLWIYMGAVAIPTSIQSMYLEIVADAASGSIDFDTMAFLAVDSPWTDRALAILPGPGAATSFGASTYDLVIDHRLLDEITPAVYFDYPDDLLQQYQGNPVLYMKPKSTAVAVAWLGTGGNSDTHWRATNASNATFTTAVTVVQSKGYLSPR